MDARHTFIRILVDDVLEIIFRQLILQSIDIYSFPTNLPSRSYGTKVPAFSQVCRRWRSVALSYPRLWRTIEIGLNTQPTFVQELISRSEQMPLVVSLQLVALEILSLLWPHAPRIQVFLMHIPDDLDKGPVAGFVEHLLIFGAQLENLQLDSSESIAIPLSSPNRTSGLKTLLLGNVSVPWTSAIFEGLTSLTLTFASQSISLAQLMQILHKCPFLWKLTLSIGYILPDSTTTGGHMLSPPHVHLSCLQIFRLHVLEEMDVSRIMTHLTFSESACFRIVIKKIRENNSTLVFPSDCTSLERDLATSTKAVLHGCKPRQLYSHPENIWFHLKSMEFTTILARNIYLTWVWCSSSSLAFNSQPLHLGALKFPMLQTLRVGHTFLSQPEWAQWLAATPGLRELVLLPTGSDNASVEERQLELLTGALSIRSSFVACPHLRTLTVSASALARAPLLVKALEACCTGRALRDAPITTLKLYQGEDLLDVDSLTILERIAPVQTILLPPDPIDQLRRLCKSGDCI